MLSIVGFVLSLIKRNEHLRTSIAYTCLNSSVNIYKVILTPSCSSGKSADKPNAFTKWLSDSVYKQLRGITNSRQWLLFIGKANLKNSTYTWILFMK